MNMMFWALLALLFGGVAASAVMAVPALRRRWIMPSLLRAFKARLPAMSPTEREALEAGTVWWEGQLFRGAPNWRTLLGYTPPKLSAEEEAFLNGPVEELCRQLDDWQITEELHDLPPHVWQFLKEGGFFGMIIPRRYGGQEFSALAHSAVVMKIASRSLTAAVTVMVPNSLGPAELLLHYGTQAQKDHYLPRLARGLEIPCFALTGPEAGSDASSIPDRGIVCQGEYEGRKVLGIRLTWEKRYITLGPVATVLGLAFRLYDPQKLLGDKEDLGITLALIPTHHPGVIIGRRHFPLNIPFMNGPNSGRDVFIPLDWVIGGRERVGQGWRMLMECLAAGRSISLPALAVGAAKLTCRATGAYARVRKQFKTPIGRFEGVQEALARMAGYTYLMDATRRLTAGALDLGEKPSVVSAIAKYNLTERMRKIVNDAMDVHGGHGICLGPRNFLARAYQAIPISITVEGANILTRNLITYGQGALRCHPFLIAEMRAAQHPEPTQALRDFDRAVLGHVKYTMRNALRAVWLAWSGGFFSATPGGMERAYYRRVTRVASAFALVSDMALLLLGGTLKRKEFLSGRLADVLSQLYLSSCALKRFVDEGRPAEDFPLLEWSVQDSLVSAQTALENLLTNFPQPVLGWLLKRVLFPWGRPFQPPSDALTQQIATLLLRPSATRERLTAGIFQPSETATALGRLDSAFQLAALSDEIEKKLAAAQKTGTLTGRDEAALLQQAMDRGIISVDEFAHMQRMLALRTEIIKVDDFPADYWGHSPHKEDTTWHTPLPTACVPSTS